MRSIASPMCVRTVRVRLRRFWRTASTIHCRAEDPLTRGNGTASGYGYDLASRLTGLSHDLAATAHDVAFEQGYTSASQLQTRSTTNTALGWWTVPQISQSFAANGLNQYMSVSSVSYNHDAKRQSQ